MSFCTCPHAFKKCTCTITCVTFSVMSVHFPVCPMNAVHMCVHMCIDKVFRSELFSSTCMVGVNCYITIIICCFVSLRINMHVYVHVEVHFEAVIQYTRYMYMVCLFRLVSLNDDCTWWSMLLHTDLCIILIPIYQMRFL